MAVVKELDETYRKDFEEWIATRPPQIQEMIAKYPPDRLYRMKSTGHRCTLISYAENGTMRVAVTGQYNRVVFSREVFGVAAANLEECDLPGPDEDVGDTSQEAGLTEEQIRSVVIPAIKEDRKKRRSAK